MAQSIGGTDEKENIASKKIAHTAAQTAVTMAVLSLVSKGIGFVRELIMANFFGAGQITDAFVMAQSIPGMLFGGFLAAVATAFVPTLADKVEKGSKESGDIFVNDVLNIVLRFVVICTIIGTVFSMPLVRLLARGFDPETAKLTAYFLKIAFLSMIFSKQSDIMTSYLHYNNRFYRPIIFGYFHNIVLIATIFFAAHFGGKYLAYGYLIGQAVMWLFLTLASKGLGLKRKLITKSSGVVRGIMMLAFPTFIGCQIGVINSAVDKFLASGLPEGSVSALNYSMVLINAVSALTVALLTTIIYPKLNKDRANGNFEHYNEMLSTGTNIIVIVALPCALGMMAFAGEIVQVVYERGNFDPLATAMTATALFFYGPRLLTTSLNNLSGSAFHSNKDMLTPMYIGFVDVALNITLSIILSKRYGLAGIALATTITGAIHFVINVVVLKYKLPHVRLVESYQKLGVISLGAFLSVGAGFFLKKWLVSAIWMPRMIYLFIAVAVACLIYLAYLQAFKIKELDLLRSIFPKLRKRV